MAAECLAFSCIEQSLLRGYLFRVEKNRREADHADLKFTRNLTGKRDK